MRSAWPKIAFERGRRKICLAGACAAVAGAVPLCIRATFFLFARSTDVIFFRDRLLHFWANHTLGVGNARLKIKRSKMEESVLGQLKKSKSLRYGESNPGSLGESEP
ncbi:hypothetical protein QG37_00771 [Candidozyma auris]|nr:hypothetical protein QG37_00771 [[Candida] auris]